MPNDAELETLLIPNAQAWRALGCGASKYWGDYVRNGKVIVVGSGTSSRAYRPSVLACVEEMVAKAKAAKAAAGGRPNPKRSARARAVWAARRARKAKALNGAAIGGR
jgi:hypothetical protein